MATLLARVAGERAPELTLSRKAATALLHYDWPLNVRELEHALRVASAIADGGELDLAALPAPVRAARHGARRRRARRATPADELARELTALLERHRGNVSAVARDLGKSRVHVHRLLKRFAIDAGDYRRS